MSGQLGLVLLAAAAASTAVLLLIGPVDRFPRRLHAEPDPAAHAEPHRFDQLRQRFRPGPRPPIAELLGALAAELSAGRPTASALVAASTGLVPQPCPRAVVAARSGGDVPAALHADAASLRARTADAQALRGLAACWEVAEHSGAGLGLAVARLGAGRREAAESEAELASELAGVRTSARLLALLPLFGLLIGQWIGAEPLDWLLGSAVGRAVLVAGIALQLAGIAWLRQMVSVARGRL